MSESVPQAVPGARVLAVILLALVSVMCYLALVRRPMGGSAGHVVWPDMRIDLNTASVDELQVLPRIGPGLAGRIVEDRQANGPFGSLEDLDRVPQVGPSVLESIRPYVVLEPAPGRD